MTSRVWKCLNKFFSSRLVKPTQRLRCLSYVFQSMSLFVFKNFFLSLDLFLISLFIVLFVKRAWFAWKYLFYCSVFLNTFIKCCFEKIKLKAVVFRGFLRYPITKISDKHLIRKIFITSVLNNGWLFCRILSLPLTHFYEKLTSLFQMSQNFKSLLASVCYYKINTRRFFQIFKRIIIFN